MARKNLALVSFMFLVSGATGLLYEVAFSKVLATIFGATAYAISTVLSAFMAGLALGAHLGGRVASRIHKPLVGYGVAEVLVGLVCAATPWFFDGITTVYLKLIPASGSLTTTTAIRGALTFIVIVFPTACMGATLPMLSRVVGTSSESDRALPRLYAVNTVGGALGSMLAAYLILPTLGIHGTMRAAALINVALGLSAIVLGMRSAPVGAAASTTTSDAASPDKAAAKSDAADPLPSSVLLYAFASGFLVFATEVVETHLLSLLIGNSAYAFGLMLAVFLVCLGIGAARAPSVADRTGWGAALAWTFAASALALSLATPLWDQLPRFFALAGWYVNSWAGRELCRGLAAFMILVVPTIYMGMTFPILLGRVARRASVARDVGRLTVANTAGTILGSILTGYVVLPLLGSQRTLIAIVVAFVVLAGLALRDSSKPAPSNVTPPQPETGFEGRSTRRKIAVLGGLAALACVIAPRWDLARLTNGVNVYFTHGPPPKEILFVREDVHGGVTTVVRREDGILTLLTNGKFQGDNGPEMSAQRRFAHFPSLFLEKERRALVIGLGTGTTLSTVAAYPFERIDVAEISPAIVEAAKTHFRNPELDGLADPRTNLTLNDGRNVLLLAKDPYDLITIELTSVWFAGASNLYSAEFYELAKSRLYEEGVLQQWVQLHHIRPRELATIVRTLMHVFPHVALFEGGAQGILVASRHPLVASRARLTALEGDARMHSVLGDRHLLDMLDEMVASDEDLARLCDDVAKDNGGPIIATDDNLFLEYATPKGNVLDHIKSLASTREFLGRYKTVDVRGRHLAD
ncbi:MAG: fused MFS/spermidine synthase [Polyangiaceae bacterium]